MNVIIIGTGLGGLSTICEWIKRADDPTQPVHLYIVEKRPHFTRRQKIVDLKKPYCAQHEYYNLYPLVDWETYCRETFNLPNSINVGFFAKPNLSAEEKLMRKFVRHENNYSGYKHHELSNTIVSQNFSIKELQKALLSHIKKFELSGSPNIHFHWYEKSHITAIDFSTHLAEVTSANQPDKKTSISFDHIMVCEGAKGETTSLINDALKETADNFPPFVFEKAELPVFKHCAVRIKLKDEYLADNLVEHLLKNQIKDDDNGKAELAKLYEELYKLGDKERKGSSFYFNGFDDNLYKQKFIKKPEFRVFVASEIPDDLYDMPEGEEKRAALIKWAIVLASINYKLPEHYFEFDDTGETEQHKINASAFKDELQYCVEPAIELKDGTRIVLIGDVCSRSFYPLGHSSWLAVNQAIFATKLIYTSQSFYKYNEMNSIHTYISLFVINTLGRLQKRNFSEEYETQKNRTNDFSKKM